MTCEEFQPQLKPFIDGELNGREARRVRRHLDFCPSCRSDYESIQRMHATLRANDIVPADAMPQSTNIPNTMRQPQTSGARRVQLLSAGFAAAAALLVAIVALSPAFRPTKSFAAEIVDALERTNTWHLSGWRQIGGKRVPWEIWGRRKPFLYYEAVGNNAVYDDGTTQTRIYSAGDGLTQGLAVLTKSNGGKFSNANEEPAWDEITNPSYWKPGMNMGFLTQVSSTGDQAVFRKQYPLGVSSGVNANELFTVDRRSCLPVRYRLRYDNNKDGWDTEDISAQYDVILPQEAVTLNVPSGYQTVDLRPQPIQKEANAASDAALSIGLTINTRPLAVTKDGTILIGASAMPNTSRLSLPPNGPFHFMVAAPETVDVNGTAQGGNRVVRYLNDFSNVTPPGDVVLLSPVDDAVPQGWRPRSMTLPLTATVGIDVPGTDTLDSKGKAYFGNSQAQLTQEMKTVQLTFKEGESADTLQSFLASGFGNYRYKSMDDLIVQIADAHRSYWWSVPDNPNNTGSGSDTKAMQKRYLKARNRDYVKAARWLLIKVGAMPKHGSLAFMRISHMGTAALYYRQAGKEDLARATWKRMLADGRHIPGIESTLAEAKLGLAGKKLPEEQ